MTNGLLPGGGKTTRIHNHFSPFSIGDKRNVAGARYHAPYAIEYDVHTMLNSGIGLWWSESSAILSPDAIAPYHVTQIVKAGSKEPMFLRSVREKYVSYKDELALEVYIKDDFRLTHQESGPRLHCVSQLRPQSLRC